MKQLFVIAPGVQGEEAALSNCSWGSRRLCWSQ